ncbi:MAG: polyphosphate polymerase domain-containing protein [Clostridia bacterium]|nr:polyphosphate polymerase domain-containing protein [Clostridia bacterium]
MRGGAVLAKGLTFERSEKKYLLDDAQYGALKAVLERHMEEDAYGEYTVCNLYFDTEHNDLIRRSIEKPQYKEKMRLRSYGVVGDDDKVFLEIKKKYKGVVYKRRIKLSYQEAKAYLRDGTPPSVTGQIFNEIDYFIKFYGCKPKLYLSYDRVALCGLGAEKALRITFDRNIRSRTDRLDLSIPPDGAQLLEDGKWLMEVKAPGAMPLWLTAALTELKIYPTSFSKYGRIYEYNERQKQEEGEKESCLQVY